MAKARIMDSAKELESQAKALFERVKEVQNGMSASLQSIKRAESRLMEKEEAERRAQAEKDRAERLMELLSSEGDLAFHVGDYDEAESAGGAAAPAGAAGAAQGEAPAPEAPKAQAESPSQAAPEPQQLAPKGEEGVSAEISAQTPAQPQQAPAQPAPQGYEARPIQQENRQPRQNEARRPEQGNSQRQGDRVQSGGSPRQGDWPQNGGAYQQRQAGGNYQRQGDRPQAGGNYQRQGDRPQAGGNYQRQGDRPQAGGNYPRQGDRPQAGGNYQRQGDRPQAGAYQQRAGQSGSFRPQGQRPAAPGARPPVQNRTEGYQAAPQARTAGPNKPGTSAKSREDERRKNKKAIQKEAVPTGYEDEGFRKKRRGKVQQPIHKIEPIKIEKAVITTENISVKDLSEKIGKPAAEIIKKLFMLGIMATINQEIDFDTCALVAADYDIELEQQIAKTAEDVLTETAAEADAEEALVERPPVVTIMGHVDHGKTSLLDAIRKSSITEGEAGGITQHIGAYTVMCNGRQITFIDTPGHEAFTSMRARGAQVTDVVILVVAADDGIMPQTVEAINHAKAAEVPIVVAINKMDKPAADPDRVKQQLTEHGLVCEDWGGDTICVPVSAKSRLGLDTLLEMVLLQADVLELRANPNRIAKGTIIEAELDKGRGPIATVLVQNGTLKVGDPIVAGTAYGRVRAMMDDKGRRVESAGPSTPVEVLGFNEVPAAGDIMNVAEVDKITRQVAEERRDRQKAEQIKKLSKVSLDDLFSQIAEGDIKDLNIIIKADVQGSVEAVKQALEKLSNEEVRVKCIHGAVGAITGSDVMFASASNAIIIGFNVRPDASAREKAAAEKVDMRMYRIIYDAIEDIQKAMKGLFAPVFKEVVLGTISVRSTFKVSGVGTIAGAYVQDGRVTRNAQVRCVRDGIVIHEGKISSLKRFKDDVKEVKAGYECGIGIENFNDIREGDTIEAFVMEQVER